MTIESDWRLRHLPDSVQAAAVGAVSRPSWLAVRQALTAFDARTALRDSHAFYL